ncbi:unnamed protein product [Didymodactylos carnosus]|uniref:Cytochrome P450 n=1 Tax=Didymodactylos carnosus TaxID=1234261 RepID=A0A814P356_9BILA|nr:unnamed protein product [Didymodactylos carnosus]CAF3863411.1 unnamed protein product [Didymodactylos carnosus]
MSEHHRDPFWLHYYDLTLILKGALEKRLSDNVKYLEKQAKTILKQLEKFADDHILPVNVYSGLEIDIAEHLTTLHETFSQSVMSATSDMNLLGDYYATDFTVGTFEVGGRTFPIEDEYLTENTDNYVQVSVIKAIEIHNSKQIGDILVFLSGQDEIDNAISDISGKIDLTTAIILPLHGKLTEDDTVKSKFVLDCRQRYGSVFQIKLPSKCMTFITDPRDWTTVYGNSNFCLAVDDVWIKIFGMSGNSFKHKEIYDEEHRLYTRYLQSNGLNELTQQFGKYLRQSMSNDKAAFENGQWKYSGLLELSHLMIYEASTRALFGDIKPLEFQKQFNIFDEKMHYFFAFLPNFIYTLFCSEALKARQSLSKAFLLNQHCNNESEFMKHYLDLIHDHPEWFSKTDAGSKSLGLLWAALGNTFPATFWSLYYILRDQKALDDIQQEIQLSLPDNELWTSEMLAKCSKLDSAITEAIRMASNAMILKYCRKQTHIQLHDQRQLTIEKGDAISLYPMVAHYDHRLYPEPFKFKYDRFLANKQMLANLELEQEKIGSIGFLPFGYGKTMCPGRFFARNQMKICAAMILKYIDYEFINLNDEPKQSRYRVGIGIASPDHDIQIRYKYKSFSAIHD